MRILKTGDPCPICGQPILTEDPRTLRLLAAIADIAGLPDREKVIPGGRVWPPFRGGEAVRKPRPTLTGWPKRKGGWNGTADIR